MLTEYACKEVVKKLNAARANVSPAVDIPGALPELRMDGDSFASSLKQGSVNQETAASSSTVTVAISRVAPVPPSATVAAAAATATASPPTAASAAPPAPSIATVATSSSLPSRGPTRPANTTAATAKRATSIVPTAAIAECSPFDAAHAAAAVRAAPDAAFLDWFRVHKSGIKQFRKLQKPIVTRSTRRYAAFKAKVVEWIASCNDRDDAVQFLQTVLDSPAVSALLRRRVVRDTEAAETLVTVGEQA